MREIVLESMEERIYSLSTNASEMGTSQEELVVVKICLVTFGNSRGSWKRVLRPMDWLEKLSCRWVTPLWTTREDERNRFPTSTDRYIS